MKALFTIKPLAPKTEAISFHNYVSYTEHTRAEVTHETLGAFKAHLIGDGQEDLVEEGYIDSGAVSMCGSKVFVTLDSAINNVELREAIYGAMIGISFAMSHSSDADGNKSYLNEDYDSGDVDYVKDNGWNNYLFTTKESFGEAFAVYEDLTAKTLSGATVNNDAIQNASWW
ncbi:hypothetical protein ACNAUY_08025 [Acinetobacter tibetensis]|uniref:hypothetical protein n=1 Tax=Acinetobacter tibetensis TaxID=2943497 RepID=UPI003A4E62CD